VLTLTPTAFAVAAHHGILAHIQRVDDAWTGTTASPRCAQTTAHAELNRLPGKKVTLPEAAA
jgi:hypothetical protein